VDDDQRLAAAYAYARRSWFWPLVAGFTLASIDEVAGRNFLPGVATHLGFLLLGSLGLAAAAYALSTVPRVGRRSIMISALAGLMLNLLLIVGGAVWLLQRL
jgi:ABC-type glycerol-3-phosphate transport system permease component